MNTARFLHRGPWVYTPDMNTTEETTGQKENSDPRCVVGRASGTAQARGPGAPSPKPHKERNLHVTELALVDEDPEAVIQQITWCSGGVGMDRGATPLPFHIIEGSRFLHCGDMWTIVGHANLTSFEKGGSTDFLLLPRT